eukprot:2184877-Rhodomonas_salina.1
MRRRAGEEERVEQRESERERQRETERDRDRERQRIVGAVCRLIVRAGAEGGRKRSTKAKLLSALPTQPQLSAPLSRPARVRCRFQRCRLAACRLAACRLAGVRCQLWR